MRFNYYKYGRDVGQAAPGAVGPGGTPVNRLSRSAADWRIEVHL